jgi:hypothetical protein
MWLTDEEEQKLVTICQTKKLTQEESDAIANYNKFKQLEELDSTHTGLGPGGIFPLQDILKKHADV